MHLKLLDRAVSGAQFITGGVFECDISHCWSMCTLLMVLSLDRVCQRGLHAVLWSHIDTLVHHLAGEPCSTAGLLFPSRSPSGTILLTHIRWCGTDGFQEQGQCFFIGLSCSIPTIVFYSLSLSLSIYRLVLWSCGLRTDRVYITLSQPYTADLF